MDDTMILTDELKAAWRDLAVDAKKNKKIKLDRFEGTFSKTYALLVKHLSEKSLDRSYIELIAEAYLFANIEDEALELTCLAALVLTERMLAVCAFGNMSAALEPITIYIVEARKNLLLDFNDVNESISRLVKVFEGMYWKHRNA